VSKSAQKQANIPAVTLAGAPLNPLISAGLRDFFSIPATCDARLRKPVIRCPAPLCGMVWPAGRTLAPPCFYPALKSADYCACTLCFGRSGRSGHTACTLCPTA